MVQQRLKLVPFGWTPSSYKQHSARTQAEWHFPTIWETVKYGRSDTRTRNIYTNEMVGIPFSKSHLAETHIKNRIQHAEHVYDTTTILYRT